MLSDLTIPGTSKLTVFAQERYTKDEHRPPQGFTYVNYHHELSQESTCELHRPKETQ